MSVSETFSASRNSDDIDAPPNYFGARIVTPFDSTDPAYQQEMIVTTTKKS